MKILAFIVGLAAVTVFLLGYLQKTRKRIILLNTTSRVLYIVQYLLLSAFEGAATDVAGIVSCVLAQKKDKPIIRKYMLWVWLGATLVIVGAGMITYRNPISLLSMAGAIFHTSALWLNDEKKIRIISLLGCPCWLTYNLVNGAYGSCIGDFLSICSLLISMYRYDWKKK